MLIFLLLHEHLQRRCLKRVPCPVALLNDAGEWEVVTGEVETVGKMVRMVRRVRMVRMVRVIQFLVVVMMMRVT